MRQLDEQGQERFFENDFRVALVTGMCPKALQEHLEDARITDYDDLYDEIVRKVDLKSVHGRAHGSNAMDLSTVGGQEEQQYDQVCWVGFL